MPTQNERRQLRILKSKKCVLYILGHGSSVQRNDIVIISNIMVKSMFILVLIIDVFHLTAINRTSLVTLPTLPSCHNILKWNQKQNLYVRTDEELEKHCSQIQDDWKLQLTLQIVTSQTENSRR